MLFLVYWELSEDVPLEKRMQAARELMERGLNEPVGTNILRWDTTPDGWGVTVVEADTPQVIAQVLNTWRAACPGMFKLTRTAPAIPVEESIPNTVEMLEALNGR